MAAHVIDFHSHYYETAWYGTLAGTPPVVARAWQFLTDLSSQLEAMQAAGITAKVLSAPLASITQPGQPANPILVQQINDRFAELIAAHPTQLHGLATIDAFDGDRAAREVERAIRELGLGGICVDCANAEHWLDAPEANPTLAVAAALDVPIFVHPISPSDFTKRYSQLGHIGTLLARGTEDAASVLALLRSGVFDQFPNLKLVLPMIGVAALLFAGIGDQERGREEGWRGAAPSAMRKNLYIDTMGFDPIGIRLAVQLLGAEHVLFGSDWPIMPLTTPATAQAALTEAGLSTAQQALVLADNALRLLAGASIKEDTP